ncbi:uncharacterized protein LAJ45_02632 [Morchella importuna]|uniref:uncharacterized protein n=1 Tax=Morchella importuna TaxID=1174673 RepID=UPI001E8D6741|nr:uncharacterized protein LAJ45_02632 [Morchella importuna]KAH8153045.1 hypothetical protein LAJ45_02632 [Morchella importuna]
MPRFRNCTVPDAQNPISLVSSKTSDDTEEGSRIEENRTSQTTNSLKTTATFTDFVKNEGSQGPTSVPTRASFFTAPSPEPYVSVGCLKCGSLDHSASNRNCPRPRKASTATNTVAIATQIPKKPVARTPKKAAADNHQIRKAKLGDNTKFWYYKSDDSQSEEEIGTKDSDQRNPIKEEDQEYLYDDFNSMMDGLFKSTGQFTEEQADSSPLTITYRDPTGMGKYGAKIAEQNTSDLSHAVIQRVTAGEGQQGLAELYDKNGFGSCPSIQETVQTTSVFSSQKQTGIGPDRSSKANKPARNRKRAFQSIVTKDDGGIPAFRHPQPMSSYKTKQPLFPTTSTTKAKKHHHDHQGRDLNTETLDLGYSPQTPIQPATNQSFLSRRATKGLQNDMNVNHSSAEPGVEEKATPRVFRYNYMGARNHIQQPRVRYAADRVQGWRECRSMGTGLE